MDALLVDAEATGMAIDGPDGLRASMTKAVLERGDGKLLNTYVTETLAAAAGLRRPRRRRQTSCSYPTDQQVLPPSSGGYDCLEGPLMGVQFGPYPTDQGTPDANFGAAVDGERVVDGGRAADAGLEAVHRAAERRGDLDPGGTIVTSLPTRVAESR